jgi:hypothetical protein
LLEKAENGGKARFFPHAFRRSNSVGQNGFVLWACRVRLGERVLGENPELAGSACKEQEPDPATWRHVALRMPEGEGWLAVELLRPVEWIEENHVQPGGVVSLHLPELGAEGEAEVLSLGPCPPIKSGAGHVVTGRFLHHSASNMLDLRVEGEREPIGVTANHPFWSEDRQAFVPAGELQSGERLRAESGVSRVASLTRCPDEAVCNLEVNGQHVYQVSSLGVLVHNSYGSAKEEGQNSTKESPNRQTPDQQALTELAKEAQKISRNKPISQSEAQTLKDWANEVGSTSRGPESHPNRPMNDLHIHIGGVDHIKVQP